VKPVVFLVLLGCGQAAVEPAQAPAPQVFVQEHNDETSAAPRRLDHVVTLGQDAFLPGGRAVAPTQQAAVMIQNNITVNQTPNYGYGYGYGYYGGYSYGGGRYGYSAPTFHNTPVNPVTGTPPVAGDWPRPPSYGPRPMR
jgi:hypothetical protein